MVIGAYPNLLTAVITTVMFSANTSSGSDEAVKVSIVVGLVTLNIVSL